MIRNVTKRYLILCLGTLSLVLGVVGIFIPVLPTTPFLLLSAYLYAKSSKRLYHWLLGHKILGNYIYQYVTYRAVSRQVKIFSLITLWLSLFISFILVPLLSIRILLVIIGLGVSIHIGTLKIITNNK